jgi:hypothetical protein
VRKNLGGLPVKQDRIDRTHQRLIKGTKTVENYREQKKVADREREKKKIVLGA